MVVDALTSKVEKDKKADFKSRHKLYDCLTMYGIEKQFQEVYTNAKFKEVQGKFKRLIYCHPSFVKDDGSICIYNVKEDVILGEKWMHVDFLVYFNSTKCEVQCTCRLFEFRGIMCAHSLSVLITRQMNKDPDNYILPRWRKDLNWWHNDLGVASNTQFIDRMHNILDEILEIASDCGEKRKIILHELDEIKDRVLKDDSGRKSNVPPSTTSSKSAKDSNSIEALQSNAR